MKIPLVYSLHSGNLYGTERMALSTASGLLDDFTPIILAPPGPALEEAAKRNFEAIPFRSAWEFALALRGILARGPKFAFLATGVMHSSLCLAWNRLYRRKIAHLHLVHGGASEELSYGRKRKLNGAPVQFVAVSSYVRERLLAHRVSPAQIEVIENFLPEHDLVSRPRRPAFTGEPIRRLIVISRLDPEKRVDLLLQALELDADSRRFEITIFGTGWQTDDLRRRAAQSGLNVNFAGFQPDVPRHLANSDLLVHLCPVEPFGLAIIEAMAAGIPVLVPDSGGAGSLVEDGVSGFRFRAGDPLSLNARLRDIAAMAPDRLQAVVGEGHRLLATRFSERERLAEYRRLLQERLA